GIAAAVESGFDGNFVFLGSEAHRANADALAWLLKAIWPAILAELPGAELKVIGDWTPAWRAAHARERVSFCGFLPDLAPALRGSIMLVPLRVGSGIRVKILAALA